MAQSRSTSSKKATKSSGKKSFTLEQAGKALTYVRRVVADIVSVHHDAVAIQQELNALAPGNERTRKQEEFEVAIDRLQELAEELQLVGVELKDYSTGLIDFPGKHRGKDVYLCWKLGEERIAYFHEIDAGFAGRLPVEKLEE